MQSVKQGNIKYHFWVFGMTLPRIEPPVSRTIGEHSTHKANGPVLATGPVEANNYL